MRSIILGNCFGKRENASGLFTLTLKQYDIHALPQSIFPWPRTHSTPQHTLQQLSQQTDKAQAHDSRADVQVGCGAGVATAAGAGAAGAAGASVVGVGVVGSASELALDVAVSALGLGSVLLQGSAVGRDVISRADGEGTDNVVESRELDTTKLLVNSEGKANPKE